MKKKKLNCYISTSKASLRHINSKNYEKKKIKKIAKISRAL